MRLGYQGIEYATTLRLQLPMRDDIRQHILAVRRGEVPLADMLVDAERLRAQLEELRAVSTLPAEPDMAAINAFLVRAYPDGWTRLW